MECHDWHDAQTPFDDQHHETMVAPVEPIPDSQVPATQISEAPTIRDEPTLKPPTTPSEAVVCTTISPLPTKEFVVEDSVPVESCEPSKPMKLGEPSNRVESGEPSKPVSDPPRKRLRLMDFAVDDTSRGAAAPNQTPTPESSKKANDSHEGDRPAASVVDGSEPMDDSVSQAPLGPTTTSASRSDGGYWKPIG